MWGTDMTTTYTHEDGQVAIFIAVDHCSAACVGIHAAKQGTRFEALEPASAKGSAYTLGRLGRTVPRAWCSGTIMAVHRCRMYFRRS
jgi:hypothetical protein